MDKTLSSALSILHKTVLKPAGFSKKGAVFYRMHPTHMELFHIQASQWNGSWGRAFYVNCGAVFNDLSPTMPPPSLAAFQWGGRIEALVPNAPEKWSYSDDTIDSVREEIGRHLLSASASLTRDLPKWKQQYMDVKERVAAKARANA